MSALKSYFPPGFIRNVWHLFLLISALLATVFTIGDLVFITVAPLIISLPIAGLVVLALFCLWKAAGCVRYWALFLWSGLFLMVAATFCFSHSPNVINCQLFHLLASILLFVFFWNLGRFDWRIVVPLFLFLLVTFFGVVPYHPGGSDISDLIVLVCTPGFMTFYCLSVILALSAGKLPGFLWLIAGPLLLLFSILLFFVLGLLFGDSEEFVFGVLPYLLIPFLTSPVLVIVGAALFTLKMDPAQLEERLRKPPRPKRLKV